jgi:hypothetical protein
LDQHFDRGLSDPPFSKCISPLTKNCRDGKENIKNEAGGAGFFQPKQEFDANCKLSGQLRVDGEPVGPQEI